MERELEAALDSMSRDKRNELRRKLDECEMEDEATDVGGEQAQGTESACCNYKLPTKLIHVY